ncbi:MAG: diaminopimelate decarboxylase [Candidatus Eremiobacteraeota bacterium]|nr:diaminopimelate decarboxylase [Candidatus Eremiobacteraeota bacterium]
MMKTTIDPELLLKLAGDYGTPLYVYDGDLIEQRYHELLGFFRRPRLRIFYAMKANCNCDVLRILHDAGSSFDAVSLGEVLLARRLGFAGDRVLYTANNVTMAEVERVHSLGILTNIESLSLLSRFGSRFPGAAICMRFNTDVEAGEHKYVMTAGDESKFGILMDQAPEALGLVDKHRLKVIGLHQHVGSGISDTDKVLQGMEKLLSLAGRENFPDLEFIDFGGGFKVPYRPDEKRIDYGALGEKVAALFGGFCRSYGKELEMRFEPGKFLAAESGVLLIGVNTLKRNRGRLIAGTDSGFSQLIRPVFYDAYHHILNLSNPGGAAAPCDIYGNICESGDFFARAREIPQVREGDILAVQNAGAYCYSMGSVYNLRPLPSEVMVHRGRAWLSRRGMTYDELITRIADEHCPVEGRVAGGWVGGGGGGA